MFGFSLLNSTQKCRCEGTSVSRRVTSPGRPRKAAVCLTSNLPTLKISLGASCCRYSSSPYGFRSSLPARTKIRSHLSAGSSAIRKSRAESSRFTGRLQTGYGGKHKACPWKSDLPWQRLSTRRRVALVRVSERCGYSFIPRSIVQGVHRKAIRRNGGRVRMELTMNRGSFPFWAVSIRSKRSSEAKPLLRSSARSP